MSRVLIVATVLVWVTLQTGVAHAGLVGHWKLDDGAGTTATDATGNGHDGTLIGGPTWVDGLLGGALEFSGSSQKVDVPHSAELNPTNAFTVSLWANVDPDGSGHRSPITSRDDNPVRGYIIYVEPGNTWQFWIGTGIVGGAGWIAAQGPTVDLGEWTHVLATYVPGSHQLFINGAFAGEAGGIISPNTQQVLRIGGGATEGAGNYFFDGLVDDVRVYDYVLNEAQVDALLANEPYPFPVGPAPNDGTMLTTTRATLEWTPGEIAASHDVYFGTDRDAVANATPDDADLYLGSVTGNSVSIGAPGTAYPQPLTPGATYYWRVDAVDASNPDSPWQGGIWSFWVQPDIAWDPTPADGVQYVLPGAELSWQPGMGTLFHTVYFGASFDQVNDATSSPNMQTTTTFTPADPLDPGVTYYWRVDEFAGGATKKGDVWSFTTLPEIPIGDESLLAQWTLNEGVGGNVIDWSGYNHHGTLVGDTHWTDSYDFGGLQFDGSGDYVEFGTPADLYQPAEYTYNVWFRVGRNIHGNSGTQYLLCVGSRSDLIFGVEDNVGLNGDLMLHYYDTDGTFHAVGVGQVDWVADEWHMVTGIRDENGHYIYLDGQLRNSDTNTNEDNFSGATTRFISIGARGWTDPKVAFFRGVIDDVRIYNRALTEQEIQGLLRGDPSLAANPEPGHNAVVDIREVTSLRWTASSTAVSHDVYFGTDAAALELQGNQAGTSFSLAGLVKSGGGDYFWRIDEVFADGTVQTGRVWQFSVLAYLVVDDFESYTNDSPNRVFQAWVDGVGFSEDEHYPDGDPGNGTGALVGHDIWSSDSPYYERQITEISNPHRGQAMPLYYDNSFAPYYSEAERTFATAQDWTAEGVTDLTLYVRGDADNEVAPVYVAIGDSSNRVGVVTHADAEIATEADWVEWKISLSDFADAGVSLATVKKMYIGVGSRTAPTADGAGVIYIDDIRLTK